jgi:hypothetical protein
MVTLISKLQVQKLKLKAGSNYIALGTPPCPFNQYLDQDGITCRNKRIICL